MSMRFKKLLEICILRRDDIFGEDSLKIPP